MAENERSSEHGWAKVYIIQQCINYQGSGIEIQNKIQILE
jgi:hypothetical protein